MYLLKYFQSWTKEETDQLFDLCERFDLRFVVIADRFPSTRTVEELKERYYHGRYNHFWSIIAITSCFLLGCQFMLLVL